MDISKKAKERFCKDCNIPIKIFEEPYFEQRLILYDTFFKTIEKWEVFVSELKKYRCEQDYFEEYNKVKESAILSIQGTEAYKKFNQQDINQYSIENTGLPAKDIFKASYDGREFFSIDMRKANFSSLYHFSAEIFSGARNWEEFINRFTNNVHIIKSKYIRQVILGNCNPKRHITYEKYLMDQFLIKILPFFQREDIVFFSNDEIILDITGYQTEKKLILKKEIQENILDFEVPLKLEHFVLHRIRGTGGYIKSVFQKFGIQHEFKCLDCYLLPFVIRKFLGEEIKEEDKVFYYEGLLSKFIEIPEIVILL